MFFQFAVEIALALWVIAIGIVIEQWRSVTPFSLAALRLNVPYQIPFKLAGGVLMPPSVLIASRAVSAAGGGFIALPQTGWLIVPGVIAYTIGMDFAEYTFHRAQHAIPLLWAVHSFP